MAIQSRAEDDAEHLMFVEENMEALLSTLQACFPGKDAESARLSNAAMAGIELLLSGPDDILVKQGEEGNEISESGGLEGWIRKRLVVCEPPSSELHHTPTLDIHGVHRSTLIQTPSGTEMVSDGVVTSVPTAKLPDNSDTSEASGPLHDAHVANCHSSYIYLLSPVRFAVIQSCDDCTIVVGACRGVLSLERCERVTLICCGWQLRLTNCVDVTVHTYTPRAPLLLGDNRGLVFAPYQTFYPGIIGHLRRVGLVRKAQGEDGDATSPVFLEDCWDQVIDLDASSATGSIPAKASFKLMDPDDFSRSRFPRPLTPIRPRIPGRRASSRPRRQSMRWLCNER